MDFLSEFNQQIASAVAPVPPGQGRRPGADRHRHRRGSWRRALEALRPRQELPKADHGPVPVLLCAAAALLMMVIGDSLAKAFSLVAWAGSCASRPPAQGPAHAAGTFRAARPRHGVRPRQHRDGLRGRRHRCPAPVRHGPDQPGGVPSELPPAARLEGAT